MLVRTIADVIDCTFNRVQFTPDLMPADITGTNILVEEGGQRVFQFQSGPIFANLVLADEINRATPKTQSSLLEAMQEHQVTVARNRYKLDPPFFVLATQNPLEMEGTYPLPEAQLDRFLFKVMVPFPSEEDLIAIIDRTTGADAPTASKVANAAEIVEMQRLARAVPIAPHVTAYAVGLLAATHPDQPRAPQLVREYVRYGGSPRGAQALVTAGKIYALLDGRFNVSIEDIRAVTLPAAPAPRDPELRGRGRGHHARGDRPLDPRRRPAAQRRVAARLARGTRRDDATRHDRPGPPPDPVPPPAAGRARAEARVPALGHRPDGLRRGLPAAAGAAAPDHEARPSAAG